MIVTIDATNGAATTWTMADPITEGRNENWSLARAETTVMADATPPMIWLTTMYNRYDSTSAPSTGQNLPRTRSKDRPMARMAPSLSVTRAAGVTDHMVNR